MIRWYFPILQAGGERLVGERTKISGEARRRWGGQDENSEGGFEEQVGFLFWARSCFFFWKRNCLFKMHLWSARPPVSQFIKEITRATEEDRKRRWEWTGKSFFEQKLFLHCPFYLDDVICGWWHSATVIGCLILVKKSHLLKNIFCTVHTAIFFREARERKQRLFETQVFPFIKTSTKAVKAFFSRLSRGKVKVIPSESLHSWTPSWRRRRRGFL